jgi:purine nucleoside phosphorylase
MQSQPVLGVIGGSGLYDFPALKEVKKINPETPFVSQCPYHAGEAGW